MNVRRLNFALVILAATAVVVAARGPYAMDVGPTSAKILPERGFSSPVGVVWTNGIALGQGALLLNTGGRMYMLEVAAASATVEPTHLSGSTNDFRYMSPSLRRVAYIQNLGATNLFLSVGAPAVVDRGIYLAPGDRISFSGFQDAIHAVSAGSATNSVGIIDLP